MEIKKIKKQTALGKGLDALFEDNDIEINEKQVKFFKINEIEPNKEQPRKFFDKEKLEELASSLAEHGMLQPIIARPYDEGRYQIVSGERRWRAARMAGLMEVPVIIKELDEKTCLEIALIENLQREDLNVIEEAKGYRQLMNDFQLTQEIISKRVGKSRPVIANALRLLSLPEKVISYVESGDLTAGHARALLPLSERLNEKEFSKLVEDVINKNLTVRDLERLYKTLTEGKNEKREKPKNIYITALEEEISHLWGRKIKIDSAKNKGKIEIEFYNKEDFNNLIEILKNTDL